MEKTTTIYHLFDYVCFFLLYKYRSQLKVYDIFPRPYSPYFQTCFQCLQRFQFYQKLSKRLTPIVRNKNIVKQLWAAALKRSWVIFRYINLVLGVVECDVWTQRMAIRQLYICSLLGTLLMKYLFWINTHVINVSTRVSSLGRPGPKNRLDSLMSILAVKV